MRDKAGTIQTFLKLAKNKSSLQKICNYAKSNVGSFIDVNELGNVRRFAEDKENQEFIKKNPFVVLSDLNKDGVLGNKDGKGKSRTGAINTSRVSEEALYDVFLSKANKELKEGDQYYTIVDGPKTTDLIKGFVAQLKMANVVGEDVEEMFKS